MELKPCPFCGDRITIYYSSLTGGYYFMHEGGSKCILKNQSTICGNYHSLSEAYEAWNRRTKNG